MLYAPIDYQGSKRNELEKIKNHLPDLNQIQTCVDVFGGGGSVSLMLLHAVQDCESIVIYNDIDKEMCDLFTILKSEESVDDLLEWLDNQTYTEEEFRQRAKIYSKNRKNGEVDIYELLYLKRIAFRGLPSTLTPNKSKNESGELELRLRKNYKTFEKYPSHLINLNITNMDALQLIESYKDDPEAFLYLDPPYVSTNNSSYNIDKNSLFDMIQKLMDIMVDGSYQCKIMLHIEFIGYTFDKLKDVMREYYPKRYNLRMQKNLYQKYIMIATNY